MVCQSCKATESSTRTTRMSRDTMQDLQERTTTHTSGMFFVLEKRNEHILRSQLEALLLGVQLLLHPWGWGVRWTWTKGASRPTLGEKGGVAGETRRAGVSRPRHGTAHVLLGIRKTSPGAGVFVHTRLSLSWCSRTNDVQTESVGFTQ